MTIDVKTGMSLDEIMMWGEDPSLYTSLTSNVISSTSDDVATVNDLVQQISEVDPEDPECESKKQALIDQIVDLSSSQQTSLTTAVQSDLTAQETLRDASTVNDTIAVMTPFNAPSKMFDLVASDMLRQLADKIITRRLDQDRE
jgi:hypothetical protein